MEKKQFYCKNNKELPFGVFLRIDMIENFFSFTKSDFKLKYKFYIKKN